MLTIERRPLSLSGWLVVIGAILSNAVHTIGGFRNISFDFIFVQNLLDYVSLYIADNCSSNSDSKLTITHSLPLHRLLSVNVFDSQCTIHDMVWK
jgi:hypothetical protein